MLIRLADENDLERISFLSKDFMRKVGMNPEDWERKIPRLKKQIAKQFVVICEMDQQVVGYTAFYDQEFYPSLGAGRVHITNSVVDRNYRRKGIAEAIRRELIEICRRKGFQVITTNHRKDNAPIIALSLKLGFQEYEEKDMFREEDVFYQLKL